MIRGYKYMVLRPLTQSFFAVCSQRNIINYTLTVILEEYEHFSGHAVTQLVEALRYKPEGGGFNSR
jgi:hypothetical protein